LFAACHIVKNYIAHLLNNIKVPLILGRVTQLFVSVVYSFVTPTFFSQTSSSRSQCGVMGMSHPGQAPQEMET